MTRSFGNGPENLGPTPIFLLGENHHIFGSYFYFFSGASVCFFGWLARFPELKDRRRLDLPRDALRSQVACGEWQDSACSKESTT